MTKEPIMINDVDVSGCEYFSSGLGYCTVGLLANDGTHICECEQNCYYKQLKRKEQECKRLKKFLNEIRYEELSSLDIDLDEYETSARQLDYSNIITLVERALGEIDD